MRERGSPLPLPFSLPLFPCAPSLYLRSPFLLLHISYFMRRVCPKNFASFDPVTAFLLFFFFFFYLKTSLSLSRSLVPYVRSSYTRGKTILFFFLFLLVYVALHSRWGFHEKFGIIRLLNILLDRFRLWVSLDYPYTIFISLC